MIKAPTNEASPVDEERRALAVALVPFAALCLLGNVAGSALRYPDVGAAVMFPPYAVLTAALVVSPRRDWLRYILIAAAAHFATHWPRWSVSWVVLADVANVARALCAAMLLRRIFGGAPRLRSVGALAKFVVAAALVAPAVGATLGAANAMLHGATASYWLTWNAWFISNALTGLTMLPALVSVIARPSGRLRPRMPAARVVETLLLLAALALSCVLAFLPPSGVRWQMALPFYAPLPVLIWAALRYGPRGASLALTAVAFAAIAGADRGSGPFLDSSPNDNVVQLQIYLLLTALPVLCIAAVNTAREGVVRLYQALMASLHDHVAILDAHGVVIEANPAWRRFAEEVSAVYPVREGDNYVAACRTGVERGEPAAPRTLAGVIKVLNRDQQRFETEYDLAISQEAYVLRVEALERPDGGAVVIRSNVTARRRTQLELEEQRRQLSHLARAAVLGQLSGALAHELNQPLTAILSNADAARHLLKRQPPDLEELGEILDDIATEDRRAADVIHHLRAFFKRGGAEPQSLDAAKIVEEVLQLAREELITRRVVATTSLEPALPPALGDRVEVQQVLLNLILNGCEAMGGNAATDRALAIGVRADDGFVHFSVRDQGTGIDAGVMGRLFEPFVTTKPEGLGLGLSISHTIIAAHGGRLWAENNDDRGATLHCLLPRAAPDAGP